MIASYNDLKMNKKLIFLNFYKKKILPFDICMHAVSQGALGIECRLNDLTVIQMVNKLNHEETLLRCIAERTFLARLEGGCSAPVGVISRVTDHSIYLEGNYFLYTLKQNKFFLSLLSYQVT